ncbi:PREDICTED: protein YIPF1-like isoform X2 [Nelumbo nucifera]|uniref:Protein YIPF1-like isoform X2 n=1 Tax=Nelumbo nucifera TaxID=4432 RepID=A0A1U8ABD0_NELNU|nr:PREDICTED: protein YIPF1-like isoform X2 [Nelumbo nucifera]
MDESYTSLPSSHLLGSVPAVVSEEKKTTNYEVPEANLQIFPPAIGADRGHGYQSLGSLNGGDEQQATNNWKGLFSISSYTQYFNVDADIVVDRIIGSMNPTSGNFFDKIEANPDLKLGLNRLATSCGETHLQPKREQQNSQIPSAKEQESNKRDRDSPLARQRKQIYGLIWISATLVFLLASLGNCATYLIHKQTNHSTSWSFDVSYVSVAACTVYGYVLVVPTAFYFLLQYLGISASLVRFWCMWGYSLFIFIPTSGNDLMLMLVSSFVLQVALALFIKIWFFP